MNERRTFRRDVRLGWRGCTGVTLIELMIVVAIIGILTAIAVPTYQGYVEQTRRATAQSDLMELSQWMEKRYSRNFSYQDNNDNAPTLPFNHSPQDYKAAEAYYGISFDGSVTDDAYTLQAKPKNAQTGDDCGTLTLDHQGNRGSGGSDCW
ncbi:type IV pilin protein [Salicola sp. Rm-C-2C1-2]|uniref:type IV pilin protein n=1 Tax=Salicola sp. Rm-C-2C1-2 TaxID=3141321 RepID=UPI0032E52143